MWVESQSCGDAKALTFYFQDYGKRVAYLIGVLAPARFIAGSWGWIRSKRVSQPGRWEMLSITKYPSASKKNKQYRNHCSISYTSKGWDLSSFDDCSVNRYPSKMLWNSYLRLTHQMHARLFRLIVSNPCIPCADHIWLTNKLVVGVPMERN